jgi:uncharacterized protein YegL
VEQSLERGDPRHLGNYTLRGRAVRGGRLWQTFEGARPDGGRIAVKLVHAQLARDPAFRAGFAEAVAKVRTMRGRSVVPVTDADLTVDRPWLVTDFVPGNSLAEDVAAHGPMLFGPFVKLMLDVTTGLQELHEGDTVHGALHPSNILRGRRGYQISDFGFSHLSAAASATASAADWFLPSEHAPGTLAQPASDIYSLGAVLVFAVTGQRPSSSGSPVEILSQWSSGPDGRGLPDEFLHLIRECLDEDPLRRPAVTRVFERVLYPHPQGHGVRVAPYEPSQGLRVAARRPRSPRTSGDRDAHGVGDDARVARRLEMELDRAVAASEPFPAMASFPAMALDRPAAVGRSAYAGRSGPAVPLTERTDPLPHDGLFIRRNNAFGTKSTIGISDLIEQGVLIDQERIRFDDFVASRSDEVPLPATGEAVGVSCGLARTVPDCRASQHATHFLEIALRAADSAGTSTTPPALLPVNFVFVVDTSGSMTGGKLAAAKGAIRGLYDQLRNDDIIGIVSFDTTVRTVLRAKRKGDLPPAEFISLVEGLTAGGGTDLNLGVRYGIHEINRNAEGQSSFVNCVYLFSDGAPTSGETDWIQIRSNIAADLRGNLTLSCFGFGTDARMRELEALAGLTGGHCTLVNRPEDVRLNLAADLARREHLAAINIQLKIDISPDVGIWHLYGHDLVTDPATRAAVLRDAAEARERGEKQFGAASLPDLITEEKGIRIFAPDLAFGETYWIVLELAVPDSSDTSDLGMATVQYVDAVARAARRHEVALRAPGQLPEAVVAGHAIGLWTSEVTFYALDDLYENDRTTAKERLNRHIKILQSASQHVPAPWFSDDRVVLSKLISLTDNLQRPLAWADAAADGSVPMQFQMHAMSTFGRLRGGYGRRYF